LAAKIAIIVDPPATIKCQNSQLISRVYQLASTVLRIQSRLMQRAGRFRAYHLGKENQVMKHASATSLVSRPRSDNSRSGRSSELQLFLDFDRPAEPTLETAMTPINEEPASQFALRFAALLEADPKATFNNAAISELTREIFGSSAGHARDAYDAVEAGFNLYLQRIGLDLSNPVEAIGKLLQEQQRLPTQTRRDDNQINFQQFSTPPAEALVVVKAAALRFDMTVLEPSAGTGNLAVLARLSGAQVDTNEIDHRRYALLSLQGFHPTQLDAERLDNLLPLDKNYHAIVMNPPFSATGGRVSGHRTEFGARHIEQALLRLKPGGRLVAIVGCGMALDRPAFGDWWNEIARRYNVRANIGIDGQEYAKFGTSYDNQIIVIDHAGPTTDRAMNKIITAGGLSVHEAYERLKDLAKEDVYGRVCERSEHPSERGFVTAICARSPAQPEPDSGTDFLPSGRRGRHRRSDVATAHHGRPMDLLERSGAGARSEADASDERHPGAGTVDDPQQPASDAQLGGVPGAGNLGLLPDDVGQLETHLAPQMVDLEAGTVFAAYRVQKAVVRGASPHPANVVESAAMACVEPPDVTYLHHLPTDVIAEGRISNLQLEDVIYAGQATSFFLPDNSRKGHWNGDGTGIGKGREIYAFVYNELEQGRKKHVHVSAAHQLVADAERDRSAVGLPLPIIHQAEFKMHEPISGSSGVLFTTYTMLSHKLDSDRERFKQLVDWLGKDFDGVIAFDEAHLMKNAAATPHGGKATVAQGTLRGNMGIELQRMFPSARVRYFSATGATEARHMAPYERLGLWGVGAPFADFPAFLVAMERGGVAAMEMLSRDLKSVGTYLSRTISYGPTRLSDGSILPNSAVEYEPLLHKLTPVERAQYDRIADLWSNLLVAFESASENACQGKKTGVWSQFYSAQQRFFLQLMMAYTLPDLIPAIEQDLCQGRSVVLSLFNTGEAQTDRKVRDARASGLELSELDATPREMVVQLVEKHFPLHQYQEHTDPKTGIVTRSKILDSAGNPEINRENQRRQQELLDTVADIDFPQNPLDAIISHFEVSNVAEISGRSHRFEDGKYVRRKLSGVPPEKLNEYETRLFQRGQKRIAVISGAGSIGISVHADKQAKNQDRRVFYAFQLSWSADQQMQAFGRVHRSNQSSAPIIRLVLLDLAGQKRLVNAVSKRLAALGAITKGERHSLASDLFRPEDVTDSYGKASLTRLYSQIAVGKFKEDGIGITMLDRMGVLNESKTAVRDKYCADVERFLNRIMVLHVEVQNKIFERFYERYLEAVEAAKRQGAFDFGVEQIEARNLRQLAQPETLFVDPASGARTLLHELEGEIDVERHTFNSAAEGATGFYRNKRSGRIYAVSDHWDAYRPEVFLTAVKGPRRSLEQQELDAKYEPVEKAVARQWWDAEYENTPATEPQRFHILSGAIFPIYDKVMGSSGIQCVRIARAILSDGTALVGLNLAPEDVPNVKQRLGIGTPLSQASPAEVLDLVAGGSMIALDNGWRLSTARIAGDYVLELSLNGVPANRKELESYGLKEEIIQFKRRWFVVKDDASEMLTSLLAHRKAIKDLTIAADFAGK
jgi:predicted RNA methylase